MKTKIINLAKRADRWEAVQLEVQKFGIIDYERFDAIEGGYMGFNRSVHKALEGESELLLLEDDCVFDATMETMFLAKSELPDDWDLMYLGANLKSKVNQYSEHLYTLTDAWTSHAILYSDKGAKWCYENFDPEEGAIYDEWLRTIAQRRLKCFVMFPMIAFQADGWSDIWGANAVYGIQWSSKHFYK